MKFHSEKHQEIIASEQMKLFYIATKMKKAELPDSFIVDAVQTALEYEGVADLMHLWEEEQDTKEQDEIIADIQDMIDACGKNNKKKYIIDL